MKPNHLVILAFGLFMVYILVLVVKTYHVNTELVSEDYYQQELDYQHKINKLHQTSEDSAEVSWKWEEEKLVVVFPRRTDSSNLKGTIVFYRPSDSSKDLAIPIQVESGQKQHFPKQLFVTGLYKMKVDWSSQGKEYYTESDVYVQ
jgi:nitrogen fixation protein FixH